MTSVLEESLPQNRIAEEKILQAKSMNEITIIQEKTAEVKKALYIKMSKTTAWRKNKKLMSY
ncbi:8850_t:CDS:2 [Cetraspora pellucida]|uniref:8850_t:CDS:1 n=1 Tax=Cetraspora pellucida TaxID=1433469 RepID=A0ACA9K0V6_9GLOM|nr:8850_t:CDS:2 [Cetraspora pellucida]